MAGLGGWPTWAGWLVDARMAAEPALCGQPSGGSSAELPGYPPVTGDGSAFSTAATALAAASAVTPCAGTEPS